MRKLLNSLPLSESLSHRTNNGKRQIHRQRLDLEKSCHPWSFKIATFHSSAYSCGNKHKSTAFQMRRKSYRPEGVDPEETTVLLFPGQGAQFVGMGKIVTEDLPSTKNLYYSASEILGYDLLDLCLNGPLDQLDRTIYCQPAVVVTSLAAAERLRHQNEGALQACIGAAGFSVGEISALIFAGAISFEDGIRLVQTRAEAMQRASERHPSSMATVFTTPTSRLDLAFDTAKEWCLQKSLIENPVIQTANYLYSDCKVIAGHAEAIDFIKQYRQKFNIKRLISLPVSGAFHTVLMTSASKDFEKKLNRINVSMPTVPVYSNVSATYYRSVEEIRAILPAQITSPVKWEQLMHVIFAREKDEGYPSTYEVGPGSQLGSILHMVNRVAHENYMSITV